MASEQTPTDGLEPVILRYRGLDASDGLIDLGQLGQSIQGASKLLGVAGNLVMTGQYAKKAPALGVRVLTAPARQGSFELSAFILPLIPLTAPLFPALTYTAKVAGKKAVEALVNYTIAKWGDRPKEAEAVAEVAVTALQELGRTTREAMASVERIASSQRPAARLFVVPVGLSCDVASIGEEANGAIPIDRDVRLAIEAQDNESELGALRIVEVLISELDIRNRSCKVSLREMDDADARIPAEIIDTAIVSPNNPYATAMKEQRWLTVIARPWLREGDTERLQILGDAPEGSIFR